MYRLYNRLAKIAGGSTINFGKLTKHLICSDDEIIKMQLRRLKKLGLIKIDGSSSYITDWTRIEVIQGKKVTISKNGFVRIEDIKERRKVGA